MPGKVKLIEFLKLVRCANWRSVPQVWNREYSKSLSDGLVTIGFGGAVKLTPAGRAHLSSGRGD